MAASDSSLGNLIPAWWKSLNPLSKGIGLALALPLLVLNAWAIARIFSYFHTLVVAVIIASLVSFLLSYPTSWLQRTGLQRGVAAELVFVAALLLFGVAILTIVPLAIAQAQQLISKLPERLESAKSQLIQLEFLLTNWGLLFNLNALITQVSDRFQTELETVAGEVLDVTLDLAAFTAGKLTEAVLTVILTFYLLLNGPEVWKNLLSWLPPHWRIPFAKAVRRSFRGYFTGQIIVATTLGATLTAIYALLKISFGLLFGLTIGLFAIVPFASAVGTALVTFVAALRDIGAAAQILVIALVLEQLVENGIAPRVLGSMTGLNPFWVLLAVLAEPASGGYWG